MQMNIAYHFLINYAAGRLFGFASPDSLVIALSGVIIDVDHLINVFLIQKLTSARKIVDFAREEGRRKRPHLYIFHTAEFLLAIFVLSMYVGRFLLLVAIGFLFHLLADAFSYILRYRSMRPWIGYFSGIYLLMSGKPL
jgi:hypothetical protein